MARILSLEPAEGGTLIELDPYGEMICKGDLSPLKSLVGIELDEEGEADLWRTLVTPALNDGAATLAMRPLTRKLLIEKLVSKGHDELLAERAADKLEDYGAIDDAEYARLFAQERQLRGWGSIRIRNELRHRGVDDEMIDEVLDELGSNEEAIESFIISRAKEGLLDRKAAKKVSDALMRKGFRWDEISPILREYTEE